jgi:hypothetical protein
MAKKRPAKPATKSEFRHGSNADLVEAAESVLPDILMYYQQFRDKRPVMLLDIQSERIHALPYEKFKADLSEPSQATLTACYEEALVENKIVVFVRDNETRRLVSMLFRNE